MEIEKEFGCSVSRSVRVGSISKAKEMEVIANNLVDRIGNPDKYAYFTYSHEYYPGNSVFELDVHMLYNKSAMHNNSPIVYIEWSRCDFEAEFMMNKIIRECFDKET